MTKLAWSPKGYRDLVARDPLLSMRGVKPTSVAMDGGKWKHLSDVNTKINTMAVFANDPPGQDKWGPFRMLDGVRVGDCDDFAVHKLKALIASGWPRGSLRLTVCKTESGDYHCVLLVSLIGLPDACLDNRGYGVWMIDSGPPARYTWISQEEPGQWYWWRSMK